MMDLQTTRLRAMAELGNRKVGHPVDWLKFWQGFPLWRPAVGLEKSCEEALIMLDRLAERFDHKLVVTLVGPSGSGKSTLLNALAGEDNLSPSGHRRPTTERVVVFCRHVRRCRATGGPIGTGKYPGPCQCGSRGPGKRNSHRHPGHGQHPPGPPYSHHPQGHCPVRRAGLRV
jgi:hypothetical protein